MDSERLALNLAGFGIFKNMAAVSRNGFQERSKIFHWMKLGLMGKMHSRLPRVRNLLDELGFKPKFARQLGVLLHEVVIFFVAIVESRMQISRHPLKITINSSASNDIMNLIDGCHACLPKNFRGIAAKNFDQVMQPFVGYISQVRSRMTGVAAGAPVSLD